MYRICASVLGIACSLGFMPAEQAFLSGPVEGYLFDAPTHSIRAVQGFPGSASLGSAILGSLDYGSIAPHKNYGLAFKDGQCMLALSLGSDSFSTLPIPGTAGRPDGAAWSGDGSVAVLYSLTDNWIQPIIGLPDAPSISDPVDVSYLGGKLSAVASDLRGVTVAIGITGQNSGVYLMVRGQGLVSVLQTPAPIALGFSTEGSRLYALDASTMQLFDISVGDLSSQSFTLDGLSEPFAVKAALDPSSGPTLYIASRKDQLLRIYDLAGHQTVADIPLDFPPTGIDDLGRSSFVISARAEIRDPLWLFTSAPQRAVYFVPALTSGGAQ